jgi:hypothetical protein
MEMQFQNTDTLVAAEDLSPIATESGLNLSVEGSAPADPVPNLPAMLARLTDLWLEMGVILEELGVEYGG